MFGFKNKAEKDKDYQVWKENFLEGVRQQEEKSQSDRNLILSLVDPDIGSVGVHAYQDAILFQIVRELKSIRQELGKLTLKV